MIDVAKLKVGDSVFWLDCDDDIIEHTYIGSIGDIVILSGRLTNRSVNEQGYPVGRTTLIDNNIREHIEYIARRNETYMPFPVCFAMNENLYTTRDEAEKAQHVTANKS